jgi:hypothetical protein
MKQAHENHEACFMIVPYGLAPGARMINPTRLICDHPPQEIRYEVGNTASD